MKIFRTDGDDGCTILNILKTIESYSLNGWSIWIYFNKAIIKRGGVIRETCLSDGKDNYKEDLEKALSIGGIIK